MIISNIIKLYKALRYSWAGLMEAISSERAFKQEMFVAIIAFPASIFFAKNTLEFCLLFGSGMLVLITELLNCAIEVAVDRIGTEYHELAGKAKDLASAAVFLAIINAVVIWALILIF